MASQKGVGLNNLSAFEKFTEIFRRQECSDKLHITPHNGLKLRLSLQKVIAA